MVRRWKLRSDKFSTGKENANQPPANQQSCKSASWDATSSVSLPPSTSASIGAKSFMPDFMDLPILKERFGAP